MPNRIIKESICSSENLNSLPPEVEVFFYRLMVNCDDYGIMDARPSILRAKCYPWKLDQVKEADIEEWLKLLSSESVKLIFLYEVDGKRYLKMSTWENHQQIRAKRSKYPTPDSKNANMISFDSNGYHVISYVTENPIQSESESESESNPKLPAPDGASESEAPAEKPPKGGGAQSKSGKGDYTPEFEAFWAEYPRRIEKRSAFKAWNTRLKEKVPAQAMIQAARNYANDCIKQKKQSQFIKHPETFIGPNKPYEEYIEGPPEDIQVAQSISSGEPQSWDALRALNEELELQKEGDYLHE